LTKLLYKPLLKILDERSEKVKSSLAMADEARKEAEKARAEMQEEIKAAKIEGQETVTKAKNIAEKQGEEELVKAKKQIEAEKIKAQTHIQQERDAAIADLKNHFSDLVLTATENLMRQNIDAQTDKKVIDKILNEELSKLNTN
jgi:F-type H+-transporting ATPase subunit b